MSSLVHRSGRRRFARAVGLTVKHNSVHDRDVPARPTESPAISICKRILANRAWQQTASRLGRKTRGFRVFKTFVNRRAGAFRELGDERERAVRIRSRGASAARPTRPNDSRSCASAQAPALRAPPAGKVARRGAADGDQRRPPRRCRRRSRAETTRHLGRLRGPAAERQRAAQRRPAARRAGRAEVALGDEHEVGHLHDARLHELQRVAGAGLDAEDHEVGAVGDLGLGLADAHGLDDHPVEAARASAPRPERSARPGRRAAAAPPSSARRRRRRPGRSRCGCGRRAARRPSAARTDRRRSPPPSRPAHEAAGSRRWSASTFRPRAVRSARGDAARRAPGGVEQRDQRRVVGRRSPAPRGSAPAQPCRRRRARRGRRAAASCRGVRPRRRRRGEQRRLRRGEPGDRHAEGRAGDVVEARDLAEAHRGRIAAVLAAEAEHDVRGCGRGRAWRRSASARPPPRGRASGTDPRGRRRG